jgi:hypothetical protein
VNPEVDIIDLDSENKMNKKRTTSALKKTDREKEVCARNVIFIVLGHCTELFGIIFRRRHGVVGNGG